MNIPRTSPKQGFLLLEMVLALAIFSIAATGLVVALNRTSKAAEISQSGMRITRVMDSALAEALSIPTMEEGESSYKMADSGIEITTTIKLIEDLETEEGQVLQEMFHIVVVARWYSGGEWQERTVDTWRYGRLYQP